MFLKETGELFGLKHKLDGNSQLSLSVVGKPTEQVKKTKLLGIILDTRLV